jgi:Tfp pilus assembly protein PilN
MNRLDLNLNLSTRPFKPYRAANLGLTILLLILVAVSAWQGYNYLRYSSLAAGVSDKEVQLRAEAEDLSTRLARLNAELNRADVKAKLSEVEFLNRLIQRKRFSWTRVFGILEEILPEGVYLTSLRPVIEEDGTVLLSITIRGRTPSDAYQFVHVLEESEYFDNVTAPVEQQADAAAAAAAAGGEVEIEVSTNYFPEKGAE